MGDRGHPTVTTPGGSDLFAGLSGLDYEAFDDDHLRLLVEGHLPTTTTTSTNSNTNGSDETPRTAAAAAVDVDAFVMTPRTAGFMSSLVGPDGGLSTPATHATVPPQQPQAMTTTNTTTTMLFDHDLVAGGNGNGSNGISRGRGGADAMATVTVAAAGPHVVALTADEAGGDDGDVTMLEALKHDDDLPTPLTFSFTPTGANGQGIGGIAGPVGGGGGGGGHPGVLGPRYHAAPLHKHKRVRSNPDVMQNLSYQQLLASGGGAVASSPLRPSVVGGGQSVSQPTTPLREDLEYDDDDGSGGSSAIPAPLPISIGTVDVVTPMAFHHASSSSTAAHEIKDDTFPVEMDSFLNDLKWSEFAENNGSMNQQQQQQQQDTYGPMLMEATGTTPVGFRTQRIQASVNDLHMKRKRGPTTHARHHSNPVDLLHNLDQFRILSQQQQQQQQQQPQHHHQQQQQQQSQGVAPPSPPQIFLSPTKPEYAAMQPTMMVNPYGLQQGPQPTPVPMSPPQPIFGAQFQVPAQVASGHARSMHSRRSSLPNSAFVRGGRAARGGSRSTGLSMDMSQLNLEFLSLPEEEFQQKLQEQQQTQAFQQALGQPQHSPPQRGGKKAPSSLDGDSSRKSYKCGRCGQPKVGHVCTMPELRNNWTQVDLEVTKGLRAMRTNVHIVAVKSKWVTQHEDHL